MKAYQQRVVEEKAELDGKIERLLTFTTGVIFSDLPKDEQERMGRQLGFMQEYSDVLGERIGVFPTDSPAPSPDSTDPLAPLPVPANGTSNPPPAPDAPTD